MTKLRRLLESVLLPQDDEDPDLHDIRKIFLPRKVWYSVCDVGTDSREFIRMGPYSHHLPGNSSHPPLSRMRENRAAEQRTINLDCIFTGLTLFDFVPSYTASVMDLCRAECAHVRGRLDERR